jgi:ATP-binding cassette subfamily C protein
MAVRSLLDRRSALRSRALSTGIRSWSVLDEPNSNLDAEGDEALTRAILGLRARGAVTVVIAHRPSAIAGVDYILVMAKGRQQQFGPKEEVLSRVIQPASAPRSLKVAEQGGAG